MFMEHCNFRLQFLFNRIGSVILDLDVDVKVSRGDCLKVRNTMLQGTFIFNHRFHFNLTCFHKTCEVHTYYI